MLKLTKKVEYALIAIRYIYQVGENQALSTKEISKKFQISNDLLAKVLQQLARLNILLAVQGPRGGYKLNRPLSTINLTELMEAVEGPVGVTECSISAICEQLDHCDIRLPLNKVNNDIRNMFSNITLEELAC